MSNHGRVVSAEMRDGRPVPVRLGPKSLAALALSSSSPCCARDRTGSFLFGIAAGWIHPMVACRRRFRRLVLACLLSCASEPGRDPRCVIFSPSTQRLIASRGRHGWAAVAVPKRRSSAVLGEHVGYPPFIGDKALSASFLERAVRYSARRPGIHLVSWLALTGSVILS